MLCGLNEERGASETTTTPRVVIDTTASSGPKTSYGLPGKDQQGQAGPFRSQLPITEPVTCHEISPLLFNHQSTERPKEGPSQTKRSRSPLTCLFCSGKVGKRQHFSRQDTLRKHHRSRHFQYQVGSFICPVPGCGALVQDSDRFFSHAVKVHKSDLGFRASIMESRQKTARPGQLATFSL